MFKVAVLLLTSSNCHSCRMHHPTTLPFPSHPQHFVNLTLLAYMYLNFTRNIICLSEGILLS